MAKSDTNLTSYKTIYLRKKSVSGIQSFDSLLYIRNLFSLSQLILNDVLDGAYPQSSFFFKYKATKLYFFLIYKEAFLITVSANNF